MTRVGFLIDRFDASRGGAEACLARLAAQLEASGHEVLVCASAAAPGAPGRFVPVRAPFPGALLRARHEAYLARALPAAARDAGCDVTVGIRHLEQVDLYWPHGGAHGASVAAQDRARGRPPRAPDRLARHHRLFLELEAGLLAGGRARRVVCVSRACAAELAARYPTCRERLVVVPNAVDLARFRPENRAELGDALRAELGLAPGEVLLAFAARAPRLKGFPVLLAALEGLADVSWRLVAAGFPAARAGRSVAGRLARRVRFHAEADMRALLAAADLVALPTWRDLSSLVQLEALASGTPVVASSACGEAELLDGETTGAIAGEPGDVAALRARLAAWIARCADSAPDRRRVRAAVEQRAEGPWLARLAGLVSELASKRPA